MPSKFIVCLETGAYVRTSVLLFAQESVFQKVFFLKAKFWLYIKVAFYEEFTNILVSDVVLYAELRSVLLFVNSSLQFCHY